MDGKGRFIFCLVVFVNSIFSCAAQSASATLARIAGEATVGLDAYRYVEELSDNLGPRLTGTPQAARASQWAMEKMKAAGLHHVHLEHWQLPRGWERGHALAQLTLPISRSLTVTSFGWAGSTPAGGIEGAVIAVQRDPEPEQIKRSSSKWAGRVLFLLANGNEHVDGVKDFAQLNRLVTAAAAAGALAILAGDDSPSTAGMALSHTGPVSFNGAVYAIPVLDVTAQDRLQVVRFLNSGKKVRIKLDVQNRTTPGPVDSVNVIGDLPGYEHPEQIIVAAAHLDSWDLATGAVDDGVGVAAVLAAAKAITAAGAKPRCTIRFVLFTGEEQGLLGSRAYVREHQSEMANYLGAVVMDLGQGPITELRLAGHDALIPAFQSFADEIRGFAKIKVEGSFILFTDAYSFTLAGLPGISFGQNSQDYALLHHSNADTLDKVDPEALAHNAAILGLLCFWIADQPTRLEAIWSKTETAQMLIHKKHREILEMLEMWPF